MNDIPLEAASAPATEPVFLPVRSPVDRGGDFSGHLRRAGSTDSSAGAAATQAVEEEATTASKSPRRKAIRGRRMGERPAEPAEKIQTHALNQLSRPDPATINQPRKVDVVVVALADPAQAAENPEPATGDVARHTVAANNVAMTLGSPLEEIVLPPIQLAQSLETIDSISTLLEAKADAAIIESPIVIDIPSADTGSGVEFQLGDDLQRIGGRRTGDTNQLGVDVADNVALMLTAGLTETQASGSLALAEKLPMIDEAVGIASVDRPAREPVSTDGLRPGDANTPAPNVESPRQRAIAAGPEASASSNGASGGHNPQSEVDRVRFVQRVSRAFQSLGNNEGQVRLRLSPPSLGALTLEVTLRGGEMVARLETETATAKNLLLDNLPALRERLAQQEIRVARFDVDLANHTGGGRGGEHTMPNTRPQYNGPRRHGRDPSLAPVVARRPTTSMSQSNLDVII